jgi:DNA (cytosine-5)-methyltransferase 1
MGYEVAEGLFTAAETGAPHRRERLFILAHAGHAECQGRIEGEEGGEGGARSEPPPQGIQLAHAEGSGGSHGIAKTERQGRSPSSGVGGELAHADTQGLQGVRSEVPAERDTRPETLPLYPPGPNDPDGWAYLLSVMPEALPTFCRDADGAATRVGDQLRALGNGVIPAVAATAYRELSEAIGGERYEC